jgi:hypothetical protein
LRHSSEEIHGHEKGQRERSSRIVVSPAAMPESRTAALSDAVNIGKLSESAKSTADAKSGAGRSATSRFRTLVARGKAKPKVATAIARELTGFIWAIAREVPLPPA